MVSENVPLAKVISMKTTPGQFVILKSNTHIFLLLRLITSHTGNIQVMFVPWPFTLHEHVNLISRESKMNA